MFSKEVYVARRRELSRKLADQGGIVVFLGNVEAPAQYKDNCYKWRQNSNWLYYFGIDEPRYAAVLDLDSGKETIFADDVDIDDIIWTGPMPSVASVAAGAGVQNSAPYSKLDWVVSEAIVKGRKIHAVPLLQHPQDAAAGHPGTFRGPDQGHSLHEACKGSPGDSGD